MAKTQKDFQETFDQLESGKTVKAAQALAKLIKYKKRVTIDLSFVRDTARLKKLI
jgi:predicted nuclease of restriction endonuclease-like RecB superfamily